MHKDIASLHNLAAEHLEQAARLHREAANSYTQNEQDKATQYAYSAHGQLHIASHYAKDAAKFYVQGNNSYESRIKYPSKSLMHSLNTIS